MKRLGWWIFAVISALSLIAMGAWIWFWVTAVPPPRTMRLSFSKDRQSILCVSRSENGNVEISREALTENRGFMTANSTREWSLEIPFGLPIILTGWLPAIWLVRLSGRQWRGPQRFSLRRSLFNAFTAFSIFILAVIVSVWISRPSGHLDVQHVAGEPLAIYFGVEEGGRFSGFTGNPTWIMFPNNGSHPSYLYLEEDDPIHFGRSTAMPTYGWSYHAPLWLLTPLASVAPAVWLILFMRRKRRFAPGLCAQCGYDLRATPDRCPECGTLAVPARV